MKPLKLLHKFTVLSHKDYKSSGKFRFILNLNGNMPRNVSPYLRTFRYPYILPYSLKNTNVHALDPHIVGVGSMTVGSVSVKPGKCLSSAAFVVCLFLAFVWLASYLQ